MLDVLQEPSNLILTGIIVTVISSLVYKITPKGFMFFGKYRTKEQSVAIYLGITVILGLATPLIYELCKLIIQYIPLLSITGFFIMASNFILNQSVHCWKHTTFKSVIIYLGSLALTIFGFIVGF
ncbi:MAG: hypothetical protein QXL17_03475 [Candidatus Thermoplasmatota archaeon]